MKGDIILRKKYADIIRRFLFADVESAIWPWAVIFVAFLVAVIVIQMGIIPIMGYIDHLLCNDAIANITTVWIYSRTFYIGGAVVSVELPLWYGNVIFALLDLLDTLMLVFIVYVPFSVLCYIVAMYCKHKKEYL